MPEPEPVDLLETAGAPMAKRVVPLVLVLLVVLFLLRRRRSHG
jgi:MYXO-CTERM domain-containing protein